MLRKGGSRTTNSKHLTDAQKVGNVLLLPQIDAAPEFSADDTASE
jgi:hypothetical protein